MKTEQTIDLIQLSLCKSEDKVFFSSPFAFDF